mmetsp:Transcript_38240/g.119386  ORF Transcript_38240/g.119386 Transcript_38240/m.119386 type:complete len:752 (+) Transcript_38240:64-2319(+)|eukprot:CAMPEP_0204563250 /NCGR_PEP_ID=MMETSP0661-20131031/34198_1 /ASSEMBLY_ACC=CAM_ASM_000606 /TAXON_ID=109239 /ORGANISM="Alexandrium margalefi, Strain AMGDE01CS-322" /LENGTH=751 /DNA_ID=CAMNT_0051570785 /DNA_START=59 /DNA_END=2314 /DNA_ORIENTATION=-
MTISRALRVMESAHRSAEAKSSEPNGSRSYTPLLEGHDVDMKASIRRLHGTRLNSAGLLEDDKGNRCASRFVIFPGTLTGRWWLEVWDLYVFAMILLLCYYEPYTIALYNIGKEPLCFVVLNKLLDVTFTVDMVLQFFIAWPRSGDSLHKDLWQSNPSVLAQHYLGFTDVSSSGPAGGGWFWVDLVAVLPCWVGSFFVGDNMGNPLLMLRILRLLQGPRLYRLTKLQEFVHARTGYHAIFFEFVKFLIITTLTCHWIACTWVVAEGRMTRGIISYYTEQNTWLSTLIASKGDCCIPDAEHDPFCTYLLAFYWATMTLTGVGYGDITPQNKMEYFISICCMTVAGYMWAYIVGTIVSILSSINPEDKEFKHTLDQLNSLMTRRGLPPDLKVRMRHYMYETRHFGIMKTQRELVERSLSSGLQREIASRSAEVSCILKGVFWMRDLEEEAILDIVRSMYPVAYGPSELINEREVMFVMQKGIAGFKGRVLARGDIWGHCDILLESPHLLDSAMPQTVSYVEVLMLSKRSLLVVCRMYPRADRRLRKAQIRTAACRAFVLEAQKMRRVRAFQDASRKRRSLTAKSVSEAQLDQNLTSFVNPGVKINLQEMMQSKDVRCDLQDVRQLLLMVLKNQESMEERLQGLSEEVQALDEKRGVGVSMLRSIAPFNSHKAPTGGSSSECPTSARGADRAAQRLKNSEPLPAAVTPRSLQKWASNALSPVFPRSKSAPSGREPREVSQDSAEVPEPALDDPP